MKNAVAFFDYALRGAAATALAQVAFSGTTFFANLAFLRLLPPDDFAIVGLASVLYSTLSATVLHTATQGHLAQLNHGRTLLCVAVLLASLTTAITALLGGSALVDHGGQLMAMFAGVLSFYLCLGIRRIALLSGRSGGVVVVDLIRVGLTLLVISRYSRASDLGGFTAWLFWAHIIPASILWFLARGHLRDRPRTPLCRQRRLTIFAEQVLTLSSQGSAILAAFLLPSFTYATSRAYEVFVLLVSFAAQAVEPIFVRNSTGVRSSRRKRVHMFIVIAVLFTPVLALGVASVTRPFGWAPLHVIPAQYRTYSYLFWLALLVGAFIAAGAPARWALSSSGEGSYLLKWSLCFGVLAALLVGLAAPISSAVWIPASSRILYEGGMLVVFLGGYAAEQKRRP